MTPRSSAPRVSDSRDTGAYGGEFNMSDAEFQRVADKVFEIAGIVLKDHKRQMVYTRLSRRLRALGMTSFTVYMDHLESGAGSREITEFSNAVTTNLTSFFRESHHFDHLRHEELERLAVSRAHRHVWHVFAAFEALLLQYAADHGALRRCRLFEFLGPVLHKF